MWYWWIASSKLSGQNHHVWIFESREGRWGWRCHSLQYILLPFENVFPFVKIPKVMWNLSICNIMFMHDWSIKMLRGRIYGKSLDRMEFPCCFGFLNEELKSIFTALITLTWSCKIYALQQSNISTMVRWLSSTRSVSFQHK